MSVGCRPQPGRVDVGRPPSSSRVITASDIIDIVIRSFADRATEDIFNGVATRRARACPPALWRVARRKLTQLNRVRDLRELGVPPGNRLERLSGNRAGQYSVRINEQYRVCFRWENSHANEVEVADYH